MADLTPINRLEEYLNAILTGDTSNLPIPITREEVFLYAIAQNGGGGGGGGTTNYNALSNRPQINGTTLAGNKTGAQLGLQTLLTFDNAPDADSPNPVRSSGIATALAQKVDKEAGKVLSDNNYTSEEKTKLANIAANAQVNVIERITLNGVAVTPVNKEVALNVITRAVNNLTNYYLKSEIDNNIYTKAQVDDLVSAISSLTLDIVDELPTQDISTTTIYLVETSAGSNIYMQYAYINNAWAQLGTTQVDLTNYYTKAQSDAKIAEAVAGLQEELTFDTAPTASSDNPVTSGGVYTALAGKQDELTFDTAPTASSTNPVTSGGVKTALDAKQNSLTFDTAPTLGSSNPVTSDGVAQALGNVSVDVATEQSAGIVRPDGSTITVDADGTIHGSSGIQPDEADFVFDEGVLSLAKERRIWTGTKAEWDALNSADKQSYEIVNITDDDSTANYDVYSTEEVKTNKVWIDGKPIYRKCFAITVSQYSTSVIDVVLDSNLTKERISIVGFGGYLDVGTSGDNNMKTIPHIYTDANGDVSYVTTSASSQGLKLTYRKVNAGNTGYVWVEYTKAD